MTFAARVCFFVMLASTPILAAMPAGMKDFLSTRCFECHDSDTKKGGLDLTSLSFELSDAKAFSKWVTVHDRVDSGEMPPAKKKEQPSPGERGAFVKSLAESLTKTELAGIRTEGRSVWRRLNRFEYENAVRDLLDAPWLQVAQMLPEDGEAQRFNKVGEALDVSHVQMARYLGAADYALRQAMAVRATRPETVVKRHYARQQRSFVGLMSFSVFNTAPERATFPVLGFGPQPDVRSKKIPVTVGTNDPVVIEQEGMGVVASSYEPIEPKFDRFKAPVAGRYKLKFSTHSIWVGPGKTNRWWVPDLDVVSKGRQAEPITIYAETPPHLMRRLGAFDALPEPAVQELDVWMLKGETIQPDAARLFRSRPPGSWHNPLAEKDGQPGVSFRWMEVEGPIYDEWPNAGHKLLFGDLPLKEENGQVTVISKNPAADAKRLIEGFLKKAYRRPVKVEEIRPFVALFEKASADSASFTEAMLASYSAILCSPEFVSLEERPGRLSDHALASRLSFFLWNSPPDSELRALADSGKLRSPRVLREQTARLLKDGKSRRFVNAFLDYWLDLRRVDATSPDEILYSDYYLDDLLVESAAEETQEFFADLLRHNLPARNVVASDYAFVNGRLAQHYGLPPVETVSFRKVTLPPGSPRGGLMTMASVLKVTANGTTTSPVLRGAWIMERILGQRPPPPPPSVPAVEPDIRGATTIREQLQKHRSQESCSACHAKIDPAGFALEAFDVAGGWRDRYRALGEGDQVKGFGKNGQPFTFHPAQPVDTSGVLPDGRKFADVRELKAQLLTDERQIARNLVRQFLVFSTGTKARFSDRAEVERILDRAKSNNYGVSSLVQEIVQSKVFQSK